MKQEDNIMYNEKIEQKINTILKDLTEEEKDAIYRKLWYNHVLEDVYSLSTDEDIEITDDIAETIADRYVYNGDYDCNLSYWDNIRNLIYDYEA